MMEVIQSQIQSQGSKLIIDQVIKLQSISDFQSDFFFGARIARRDIVRLWRVYGYVVLASSGLTPWFALGQKLACKNPCPQHQRACHRGPSHARLWRRVANAI